MTHTAHRKSTLLRRLALAKLRELRRRGLSYREIGNRYAAEGEAAVPDSGRRRNRLPPSRVLSPERKIEAENDCGDEAAVFLRALDALDQGIAFFGDGGELVTGNRSLRRALARDESDRLQQELDHFSSALWRLTRLRGIAGEECVEELAVQHVPLEPAAYQMKGSYIGLDLFGAGASVLVVLDSPPLDPLSPESLRERFGLTVGECRIAQLLAEGSPNATIAEQLVLSPHTIRRHTESILRKLGARSRAEAVSRILRPDDDPRD